MSAVITNFSRPYGRGENPPASIHDYLGRLVNIYHNLYTVVHVEPSQRQQAGAARLYLVRQEGRDGRPEGMWSEASDIAAPGLTIMHWNRRTQHREDPAICAALYKAAMQAAEERKAEQERANKARQEEEALCEKLWAEHTPAWAKAYLLAELREDVSDTQQDYWGHRVRQTVLLGFSKSDRNSFPEMRKLAALYPPTAHLATEGTEHRENYAGGGGYYLGLRRHAGWVIFKRHLKYGLPRGYSAIVDFGHWLANN